MKKISFKNSYMSAHIFYQQNRKKKSSNTSKRKHKFHSSRKEAFCLVMCWKLKFLFFFLLYFSSASTKMLSHKYHIYGLWQLPINLKQYLPQNTIYHGYCGFGGMYNTHLFHIIYTYIPHHTPHTYNIIDENKKKFLCIIPRILVV